MGDARVNMFGGLVASSKTLIEPRDERAYALTPTSPSLDRSRRGEKVYILMPTSPSVIDPRRS